MERAELEEPQPRHCTEFLRAVRRSRDLHRGWVSPPNDRAQFGRYLKGLRRDNREGFLVVTGAGAIAGVINVSEIVRGHFQSAYLGYYAFEPFTGRGLMRQGLRLVISHCFDALRLHRLEANIQPENLRSIALVRGLGFRCEGLSPRYLKVGGRWRDHERWALLAEDWRRGRGRVMHEEAFETFDAAGNPAGVAPRSRVHREGLWHRAANVFLFRSDGRLIVQRRAWTKDVCPGLWDLSVAEHLQLGETFERAAIRGLREELGVDGVALEAIGSVTRVRLEVPERGVKDYELQQSFRGTFDGEVRPDAAEVAEVEAIGPAELALAFERRPQEFTPWFRSSAIRLGVVVAPGIAPSV